MLDLTGEQLAVVKEILRQYVPEIPVWAFGSRTTTTRKPHSDLDLLLITNAPLPLSTMAMLEDALAESDLPFRVDVLDRSRTSAEFRAIIEAAHEVLV